MTERASPARNQEKASTVRRSEAPRWVLKSAQTGQALLARAGSDDTVSVRVGETVAGLGRITAIQNEGGRWVVQGTQGRVAQ